jgi:hypothetical protein
LGVYRDPFLTDYESKGKWDYWGLQVF